MRAISSSVRVVPVRERRWPAWIVGTAGALALVALVSKTSPHDPGAVAAAGSLGALWMLGLLLEWRPRPYVTRVIREGDTIRLGRVRVPVRALEASVAAAPAGASVALSWGRRALFVETSTLDDARALVASSGAEEVDAVTLSVSFPKLRFVKAFVVALGVVGCAVLATTPYRSSTFAVVLFAGFLASVLHVVDSLLTRRLPLRAGADLGHLQGRVRQHAMLHARAASPSEEPHHRVRVLSRGAEPTREWLGRVDALAGDAYRGELPAEDELRRVLADPTSAVHERLAAGRLLAKRGVALEDLRAALDPELWPYLFEMAHDDPAHAADALERLGPVFRA